MITHAVNELRNIAFVGHGAVGKTTLVDHLLFASGAVERAGSVDDGTSLLDTEEEERERKFSIFSSLCHFEHSGKRIQAFDTPAYPDFIGQGIEAVRAVETAVVVLSATAGIEVNTRKTFRLASEAGLGRMIVVNKCDSENIDVPGLLAALRESFGPGCIPCNVPVGIGPEFSAVVNTLHLPAEIPAGCVLDPKEMNQNLMDAIVEADESLMERFFEGEQLSEDDIVSGAAKAMLADTFIPVFFTSAKTGVGVNELMDLLAELSLSPDCVVRKAFDERGGESLVQPRPDGPLVAQVIKTHIDPFVSKMSFLRIYSGTLKKDCSVHNSECRKPIKLHQLFDQQGAQHELIEEAGPGAIIVATKVDELHVGDTITKDGPELKMPPLSFPTPMIGLAVEPASRADQQKISGALHKIEEEDPTFRISRNGQTKEMVMNGMSELHLTIVQELLQKRDKVGIVTHAPKIPYRETCQGTAEGHYRHKKQSGGSGQFAEVHLKVSHLPQGIDPEEYFIKDRFPNLRSYHYNPELNFAFVDRISGGSIPNQYIPAVEKGVVDRMSRGVIAGSQVQDVVAEVFFGKDHPVDSNETAFKIAGSACFREVFNQAHPSLLEPIVSLEITIPADKLGDITGDLNTRRGHIEGMDLLPGGQQVIRAKVPLGEVMTYSRALSSMTGGQGSFAMEFSHYDPVPSHEAAKIIAAYEHPDESEA